MTAVEQFWKEISEIIPCKVDSVVALKVYDKLKEAKEIEKELIIKAHFDGQCDETEGYPIEIAEQYYNETFKSE